MSLQRSFFRSFDVINFLLILAISTIGLLFVWSATYRPEAVFSTFFKKQAIGISTGIIIYLVCSFCDYRTLMRAGYFLYFATIGLLVFTIFKGTIGLGAQRWIDVGLFKFQPSELAKLLFPAFFTYYLITQKDEFEYTFSDFIPVLGILGFSALLILKQPDLGTALILLFSATTLLWLAGIDKRFFIYGGILFLVLAPLSWHFLKPYQKQRILVFMGEGDTHKERYQIEQSKIAIGSGGITGKGFLQGTQNKLLFLPESRTDFIFSVICEEAGLIGALLVIILYLILFIRILLIIQHMIDPWAQLFAYGLIIHIMFSAVINIGMVTGMLPIVGIPLPLVSYGVSNVWITFASFGGLQSIMRGRDYLLD